MPSPINTSPQQREAELIRLGIPEDGVIPIEDAAGRRLALIETVSHFWGRSFYIRCLSQNLQGASTPPLTTGPYGSERQAQDAFRHWFDERDIQKGGRR